MGTRCRRRGESFRSDTAITATSRLPDGLASCPLMVHAAAAALPLPSAERSRSPRFSERPESRRSAARQSSASRCAPDRCWCRHELDEPVAGTRRSCREGNPIGIARCRPRAGAGHDHENVSIAAVGPNVWKGGANTHSQGDAWLTVSTVEATVTVPVRGRSVVWSNRQRHLRGTGAGGGAG